MDRAQKKHEKALRRQRKLAKRESNRQLEVPFKVTVRPFEFGTRLKGFEESALNNISTANIARNLWSIPAIRSLYKEMWSSSDWKSREALSKMTSLINYHMCLIGGAVPPFFVPSLHDIIVTSPTKVNFVFQVFRPRRIQSAQGNIYNYYFDYKLGDKTYEVWFVSHALDRMKERLELTALDNNLWMHILAPGHSRKYWSREDEPAKTAYKFWGETNNFLFYRIYSRLDDKTCIVPIFFPYVIEDNKIICTTCLLPGMGPPPLPDEDDYKMIQQQDKVKEALIFTRGICKVAGMPDLCQPSPEAEKCLAVQKVGTINYSKKPLLDQPVEQGH